jgi:hypothetical protein
MGRALPPEATAEAGTAESRKRPWMAGLIRDLDTTKRPVRRKRPWMAGLIRDLDTTKRPVRRRR